SASASPGATHSAPSRFAAGPAARRRRAPRARDASFGSGGWRGSGYAEGSAGAYAHFESLRAGLLEGEPAGKPDHRTVPASSRTGHHSPINGGQERTRSRDSPGSGTAARSFVPTRGHRSRRRPGPAPRLGSL